MTDTDSRTVEHTPGPWRSLNYGCYTPQNQGGIQDAAENGYVIYAGDTEIAKLTAKVNRDKFGQYFRSTVSDLRIAEANARLITAAPDMLADLKRIHDLHGCDDETLAVIAKAEGRA